MILINKGSTDKFIRKKRSNSILSFFSAFVFKSLDRKHDGEKLKEVINESFEKLKDKFVVEDNFLTNKKEILFCYFMIFRASQQGKEEAKNNIIVKRRKKVIKKIIERGGEVNNDSFYLSDSWLDIKRKVHKLYGRGCMKCKKEGIETHIDHIMPRSLYPSLELDIHNLQILCRKCNMEKSNKNSIDYRTQEQKNLLSRKYN